MTKRLIYAGIGSRSTPKPVLDQMRMIAQQLAESRWLLRSGRAEGADQAFEMGAIMGDGLKEIFLPWPGFASAPQNHPDYIVPVFTEELHQCAASFHPNWNACTQAAKLLHMRNCCQILGFDGTAPVDLVICWTKDGKRAGGTGQALRIAEHFAIPIYDLALPGVPHQLCLDIAKRELVREEAHTAQQEPL